MRILHTADGHIGQTLNGWSREYEHQIKGALSQDIARLMLFKLVTAAAKNWRRLKGENQLP